MYVICDSAWSEKSEEEKLRKIRFQKMKLFADRFVEKKQRALKGWKEAPKQSLLRRIVSSKIRK